MKRHLVEPAKPVKLLDQLQAEELGAALWMTSPKNLDVFVGDRVKYVRKALGLTQAELADLLGCRVADIAGWEKADWLAYAKDMLALRALVLEALVKL